MASHTNFSLLIDNMRAGVMINSKSQQFCILLYDGQSGATTKRTQRGSGKQSLLYSGPRDGSLHARQSQGNAIFGTSDRSKRKAKARAFTGVSVRRTMQGR